MAHLWEINHPYYCNEGNFFKPAGGEEPSPRYKSFADFLEEEGDADLDYNLLFRWDWVEGEDHELPSFNGDTYYRNGLLKLFFMGQRKGLYRWATVEVCRADEPAVIEYLRPRWEHLRSLWEPIAVAPAQPSGGNDHD